MNQQREGGGEKGLCRPLNKSSNLQTLIHCKPFNFVVLLRFVRQPHRHAGISMHPRAREDASRRGVLASQGPRARRGQQDAGLRGVVPRGELPHPV
eukprot:scaffold75_cov217-Pinguiococcus_pyrenoidosus.AAC.2